MQGAARSHCLWMAFSGPDLSTPFPRCEPPFRLWGVSEAGLEVNRPTLTIPPAEVCCEVR